MASNIQKKLFKNSGLTPVAVVLNQFPDGMVLYILEVLKYIWLASIHVRLINNSQVGIYAVALRQVTYRLVILLLLSLCFPGKGSN